MRFGLGRVSVRIRNPIFDAPAVLTTEAVESNAFGFGVRADLDSYILA